MKVSIALASDVSAHSDCDLSTDHVVMLDDEDTYSGAEAARVWLDGKGYLITELLDFYLAMVHAPVSEQPCMICGLEPATCGCGGTISGGPYAGRWDDLGLDEDGQ